MAGANDYQTAEQKWCEVDPDIILLDLYMPGVDGWEISRRLRQVTKSLVILISAASFQENIVKGFEIGTEDIIAKPLHNTELIARIQRVLRNPLYAHRPNIRHYPDSGIVFDFDVHNKEMEHVQES